MLSSLEAIWYVICTGAIGTTDSEVCQILSPFSNVTFAILLASLIVTIVLGILLIIGNKRV